MNHPEDSIDKVLSGLRGTEPPSGMEHRILQSLEQRASVRPPSFWPRWTTLAGTGLPRLVLQGTVAAALLITGTSLFLHRTAPPPPRASVHPTQTPGPALTAGVSPRSEVRPRHRAVHLEDRPIHAVHVSSRQINLPAPPQPLTQEEKLLVQIAQAGNPDQLAMLNPEVRAREKAESDAEFQKFFTSTDLDQN